MFNNFFGFGSKQVQVPRFSGRPETETGYEEVTDESLNLKADKVDELQNTLEEAAAGIQEWKMSGDRERIVKYYAENERLSKQIEELEAALEEAKHFLSLQRKRAIDEGIRKGQKAKVFKKEEILRKYGLK